MKMYILVKKSISVGHAIVSASHASLAMYLKFKDTPEVKQWLNGPFYKVVCAVDEMEFIRAKEVADHVVISEAALGGMEVALAFKPREAWPDRFKYYQVYREKY